MLNTIIFAAMILFGQAPYATCQTGADVKALRKKLFVTDGYDFRVRPIEDQSQSLNIIVDLYLLSIDDLSEASETLKTTAYLMLQWKDTFLTWNPADYNNTKLAFWPQGEVWKPDIALKNSNLEYKALGAPSLNVLNFPQGTIKWYPFEVFESTCSMDIASFPFDSQTCYLKFQAWSYWTDQVEMVGGSKGIDMTHYEANSAWDVIDSSWKVEDESSESTISFSLRLKRKPLHVMLSVILPIIALAILNLCVFLLPRGSGERASYSITAFLSFAVFLTIVSSQLPSNSDSVSAISAFLIIQTLCSTLITVLALTLLRLGSFDENVEKVAVPRILISFMRSLKCKSSSKRSKVGPNKEAKMHVTSMSDSSHSEVPTIQMQTEMRAKERRMSEESTDDVEYSWKEVVNFLDVVLFVIFSIILIASLLGCFFKSPIPLALKISLASTDL